MASIPMEDIIPSVMDDDLLLSADSGRSSEGTAPSSPEVEDQEQRIRAIFGLPAHAPLPRVDEDRLYDYYRYLLDHLSFPFTAHFLHGSMTVLGLVRPNRHPTKAALGLRCATRTAVITLEFPLADLTVREDDQNHRLVDDYWYWFSNCR